MMRHLEAVTVLWGDFDICCSWVVVAVMRAEGRHVCLVSGRKVIARPVMMFEDPV